MLSHRLLVAASLLGAASAPAAQCEQQKLLPSDPSPGQKFGLDVDHDGTFGIVGAPFDLEAGPSAGAAYVVERSGDEWSVVAKHVASDAADLDRCGWRVAISGTLAASATRYDQDAGYGTGAVYLIERQTDGTWLETTKLLPDNASPFTFYGNDVDVSTALGGVDLVAVGAPSDDVTGALSGSAFVFENSGSGWSQAVKLAPAETSDEDRFGYALALGGDVLAVGAYGHAPGGVDDAGAVFVFERSGGAWTQAQVLSASDASVGANFGIDVALAGDRLVVGAHLDDEVAENAGAAYVFERAGGVWTEVAKLTAAAGQPADFFGETVALGGGRILVGAFGADAAGGNTGAAYLFEEQGGVWQPSERLLPADVVPGDAFGTSVSAGPDALLIGSRDDSFGIDAGALYAFSPVGESFQLSGSPGTISLATGGQQDMLLATCPPRPGNAFFVLGSASGTTPGLDVGDLHLPLNPDFYFTISLQDPNVYPLVASAGVLDGDGTGIAAFALDDTENPGLAGTVLHHAFGLVDLQGAVVAEFSAPLAVTLVP